MNDIVESNRIIHTPSKFAKDSLLYLEEIGTLRSLKKHTNTRNKLNSFLFIVVEEGNGIFSYKDNVSELKKNDCIFIDCNLHYSHTSDNWKISWIHFNGQSINNIYIEFCNIVNTNIFSTKNITQYKNIFSDILDIANHNDNVCDYEINEKISSLILTIMRDISLNNNQLSKYDINKIKDYIDEMYYTKISLQQISNIFFINKFHLARKFKRVYGSTVNDYILKKRINSSKSLLRFTNYSIEEIANKCGFFDQNYFSRSFKKIEGITPSMYKKMWL